MTAPRTNVIAIWVITPNGLKLAGNIRRLLTEADVYISSNVDSPRFRHFTFQKLSSEIEEKFQKYSGHIFIMSTGIVVRVIAPYIRHKTEDPAVVVIDDRGQHVISLLSGHLGGANELTRKTADIIGARPVITTATDVNQLAAIDVLAKEKKLNIENPAAIKAVNMAILKGEKIYVHDPLNLIQNILPKAEPRTFEGLSENFKKNRQVPEDINKPAVFIDDVQLDLPPSTLVLRPASQIWMRLPVPVIVGGCTIGGLPA